MDNRSIFSKTGKGSLEITKKAFKLSSEERQALILVDGKSNFAELQEKLSRIPPIKLRALFDKLAELELIREFVAKNDPPAAPPPSGAISVHEIDGGSDLDFTALAPAPAASAVSPAELLEQRRRAALEAEEEARKVREEIQRKEAERLRAEQERKATEEAARKAAEEEARRKAAEEAARKAAEEEARRKAAEEAARKAAEEEARRKAAEEAARKAAEEEARRKAAEEAARKAAEKEAQRKAAEEAARKAAEEEARRKAAEEAARKAAEEEARRKAAEEAARKAAEEEARRKAAEEAARKAAEEEARRKAAEEAARKAAEEEARRKAAEEAARKAAEEEARRKAAEEAARKAAEEEAARKAAEEEARRKAAEEAARKAAEEEARRKAAEEAARKAAEAAALSLAAVPAAVLAAAPEAAPAAPLSADEEAARYTAALTPQLEAAAPNSPDAPASLDFDAQAKAAFDADLDFAPQAAEQRRTDEVAQLLASEPGGEIPGATPLSGGGPDTFGDTSMDLDDGSKSEAVKELEAASRQEIEREAKERAKAEAAAAKEAEREAKRQAKAERAARPRRGPSIGVMLVGLVMLALVGGIAYLFMVPIDKAAIERVASERFGEPVTIGAAKFSPMPPLLTLTNVTIGNIKFANVIATPDAATLITERKIWKSLDAAGVSLTAADARKVAALAAREVPKIAAAKAEVQRIKITGVEVTGLPVAVPKFDLVAGFASSGALKQVTLATADDKARVVLAPDDKGWTVEIESRGITWAAGPKAAWDNLRAKGRANENGIKFEEYQLNHFGGSARGSGELTWSPAWKFAGNLDIGGFEAEALLQTFYGAGGTASGSVEGKISITMSGASLPRLFDAPQIDGALSVGKAVLKGMDLARAAQTGAAAAGATRFSDFSVTLAVAGGKAQLKDIKGVSGLLNVTGNTEAQADRSVNGNVLVELGAGGSRARASLKVSGTVAEPKFAK